MARPCGGAAVHGGALRARDRDAEPETAGDHHRAGRAPTATASWPRCLPGCSFEPLMTLYLTDRHLARGDRARPRPRLHPRREALPGRRDHALGGRRHRSCAPRRGARAHGRGRSGAAGARRGHRSCGRCLRPRGSLHRDGAAPLIERHRAPARSCSSTSRPARPRSSCSARAQASRPPSPRSTCCMNRNALFDGGLRPHHYCLPVLKARDAPRRAARGGRKRHAALLPRHRQRPARARHQGRTPAAAPASSPRTPHRAVCGGLRDRRRAWASLRPSPPSTARTSTACRATPAPSRSRANPGRCRPTIPSATTCWCRCAPASRLAWRIVAPA